MHFTKMHGLGNDYIYVNCFIEKVYDPAALSRIISDRHTGVGGDGLILVGPSEKADVRMRIFNADGSEAEMCGNGLRCVSKFSYEHNLAKAGGEFNIPGQPPFHASLNVETGNGILKVGLFIDSENKVKKVCVNMGQPILAPCKVPVDLPGESAIGVPLNIAGQQLTMTAISMGNPHAVFFCNDVAAVELEKIGPLIENHELFPRRVNAHFVQVVTSGEIRMRTWERGSGITMACGTGACACCVAGVLNSKNNRSIIAHLPGGDLQLNWNQQDNCVYMTGPAVEVFTGVWPD